MESKFKAGDKVRVVRGESTSLVGGEIHTVSDSDDMFVYLDDKLVEGYGWHHTRFELVEEPKSATPKVEFKYKGKVYQGVVQDAVKACDGCAFCGYVTDACAKSDWQCLTTGIVWEEVRQPEPEVLMCSKSEAITWTLDEIKTWYQEWVDSEGVSEVEEQALLNIKREAMLKQDPDYQKYLELKAKFEGGK